MSKPQKVEISTRVVGEFDLEADVRLLTDDGEDWIDVIYTTEGDHAVRDARNWAERNGYQIVEKPE